jgi:hypothetical protein
MGGPRQKQEAQNKSGENQVHPAILLSAAPGPGKSPGRSL